jgi:MoxR-like ATPase
VALLGSTDEEIKMTETAADLRKIVSEMSAMFSEREPVIRSLVVTVLARQHSLLLGPPGAAKSALARELTARFDGANYWEILLSKFVTPPQIFGPVDVAALTAKGEYRQVFEGHATDCHIAFLDEIFKCGDAALNSMLAYLNERVYHPEAGGAPVGCRLIAAITASNELAQTDALEAMFDRLLVRIEVGYIKDPSNFATFLRSAAGSPAPACPTTVTLPDLITATQQDVPAISVPDSVIDAICTLRAQLRRQEITVSDRRWKQAIRLLQASAYLDGRDEVSAEDLVILSHVLWEQISQRANVEREVLTLVNPDAREALNLLDAINEAANELDALDGQSAEKLSSWGFSANQNLKRAAATLAEMRVQAEDASRSTATVDQIIARCREVTARVHEEALGI